MPIQKNFQFEDVGQCKAKCHRPCEQDTYETFIDEKLNVDSNIMRVGLYPQREGTVLLIDKYSYTLVALFCDIGATLGFYLGMSTLSIIETMEVLFGSIRQHFMPSTK